MQAKDESNSATPLNCHIVFFLHDFSNQILPSKIFQFKGLFALHNSISASDIVNCIALNLQESLQSLSPIHLSEMEGTELMSRLDQKFLIQSDWIPQLIKACKDHYKILEVEGARQSGYSNRFIDTKLNDSLNAHTRGRKIRFKARIRQYDSNGKSFLEIKEKTVQGKTIKSRLERGKKVDLFEELSGVEWDFLNEHYQYNEPKLSDVSCHFNRLTLVSTERQERITIDTDIVFKSKDRTEGLGSLAIIEVKQEAIDRFSPLLMALKAFRFEHTPLGRRTSLSKYVLGMLLLNPDLPPRSYRMVVKRIRRLKNLIK